MYVNRFFSKILAFQATLKFKYKYSSCYVMLCYVMLCYVMLCHVREKTIKDMLLKINGTPIQQVKDTKFLLLYIDDELTWKYHVNQFT